MKILVIDNYDSFTYNLVHALRKFEGVTVIVKRNDEIELPELNEYDKIVLSPGPGIPEEAGQMPEVIKAYAGKKPFLGVCLGHQAIAEGFGARLKNMDKVLHGVATPIIQISPSYLFNGVPKTFDAGRYHSWVVEKKDLPADLEVTCEDEQGRIMAFQHKTYDMVGVQFHPESVLTPMGMKILENWINH